MGYNDSLNALKSDITNGKVTVTKTETEIVFSGKTYAHKDFIKRELRNTGLHFDGQTKTWRVSIENLYGTDKRFVEDITSGAITF